MIRPLQCRDPVLQGQDEVKLRTDSTLLTLLLP